MRGLESVMKALLPANVDVDNLLQDLETLQVNLLIYDGTDKPVIPVLWVSRAC